MQSAIHEGYEYQDYFSVSIILQLMLQRKDAEIIVDRKDFNGDKFDDLKVKLSNGITEFQIKYSDEESSHNLTKSDLSNGNGHDTALCDLFASWKTRKESENNTEIKLCLAWGRPADDDPIAKFLKPIQEHTMPFSTVAYSFDGAAFWPAEDTPPKTWKKFNLKIKSEPIEREDFLAFCNELTFILEMPKASLDLKKPGDIENVIIQQVEKLGVGIYPNDNLRVEDVIGKLAMEVKHSRAIGNKLYTNVLMGRLGLIADYGKFDQRFPVDSAHQIILSDEIERLARMCIESDDKERLRLKWRMNELVTNVVSRFNILDRPWSENDPWKDGSMKDFLLTVETAGFNVSQYIEYFHIKQADNTNEKDSKKTVDIFEENRMH